MSPSSLILTDVQKHCAGLNILLSLSVSVFIKLCAVMDGALGVMDGLISSESSSN